ncbi:MAG: hypothetical protein ABEJ80_07665 [Halarchaeum sp.]
MARSADPGGTPAGAPSVDSTLVAARRALDRERTLLQNERDAFEAFYRRLEAVPPDAPHASDGASATARRADLTDPSAHTGLDAVQRAYEETVMAAPHYEDEYGDRYRESLAAEFDAELAAALTDPPTLSPVARARLLDEVRFAVESRTDVLAELDREADALDDARAALRDVTEELAAIESRPLFECERDELARLRDDLATLADRCDDLAVERQTGDLRSTDRLFTATGESSLVRYLYADLPHRYPVLRAIAACSDRVETARRHVRTATRSRDAR